MFLSTCKKISQILLPNLCALCRTEFSESGVCVGCSAELSWQKQSCLRCAIPQTNAEFCGECLITLPAYDVAFIPFVYEGVIKRLIAQLKFHEKLINAKILANLLLSYLQMQNNFDVPDYFLPVPLHKKRLSKRGFNQSIELAKPVAKFFEKPLLRNSLKKIKFTVPQAQQDYILRQENLRQAFSLTQDLRGAHVALIDDVMTTGATVNEIARVLKQAGVRKITVLAIARTPLS